MKDKKSLQKHAKLIAEAIRELAFSSEKGSSGTAFAGEIVQHLSEKEQEAVFARLAEKSPETLSRLKATSQERPRRPRFEH